MQGKNGDANVENRLVDSVGEGENGIHRENSIDMYTLSCVKQIASGKLLYSTGSSAWCSVMTLRGEMEGGWEGGSRGRGYMYTHS